MRCKHMHKDDPENAICEDCSNTLSSKMIQTGGSDGFLAYDVKDFIQKLKDVLNEYLGMEEIIEEIDALAGDALIHSPLTDSKKSVILLEDTPDDSHRPRTGLVGSTPTSSGNHSQQVYGGKKRKVRDKAKADSLRITNPADTGTHSPQRPHLEGAENRGDGGEIPRCNGSHNPACTKCECGHEQKRDHNFRNWRFKECSVKGCPCKGFDGSHNKGCKNQERSR